MVHNAALRSGEAAPLESTVRTLENEMQIWEQARPLDGWNMTKDGIPEPGADVEVMHFGNSPESQIIDTATVDQWGICPHAKDGGHGKRSTVTHWRHVSSNVELTGAARPYRAASSDRRERG